MGFEYRLVKSTVSWMGEDLHTRHGASAGPTGRFLKKLLVFALLFEETAEEFLGGVFQVFVSGGVDA